MDFEFFTTLILKKKAKNSNMMLIEDNDFLKNKFLQKTRRIKMSFFEN